MNSLNFRVFDKLKSKYSNDFLDCLDKLDSLLTKGRNDEIVSNIFYRDRFKIEIFTGFMDCNAEKIFDGDILSTSESPGIVYQVKFNFSQGRYCLGNDMPLAFMEELEEKGEFYKIVGNVNEHPLFEFSYFENKMWS